MMMHFRFPLSLRNVEDLLHERGIDVSYETVGFWWKRFGPFGHCHGKLFVCGRMGLLFFKTEGCFYDLPLLHNSHKGTWFPADGYTQYLGPSHVRYEPYV